MSATPEVWSEALAGFSARLSSTYLYQTESGSGLETSLDDRAYNERYHVSDLFSQLCRTVLEFKPVEPLQFTHDMLTHMLRQVNSPRDQAAADDDGDAAPVTANDASPPPPRARGSSADSSDAVSPVLSASSPGQAATVGPDARVPRVELSLSGRPRSISSLFEPEETDHHVVVSVDIRRPKLLRKRTVELKFKQRFGMDIGGSLAKFTYFEPNADPASSAAAAPSAAATGDGGGESDNRLRFIKSSDTYGSSGIRDKELSFSIATGKFHFLRFKTSRMAGAVRLIRERNLHSSVKSMLCTGGGAYKFADLFEQELGVRLDKQDEITCLLTGLNFLLQQDVDECYYLEHPLTPQTSKRVPYAFNRDTTVFPYLLVNIGSGVSILRVDSPSHFERVGGSCVGGGTFWGLSRLLTSCRTFSEAMALSVNGDRAHVDMTVGDIYGGDYDRFGLSAGTIASSFGKLVAKEDARDGVNEADVAASLLHLININIGQVAYLLAKLHHTSHVIFAGSFLRENALSAGFLSYSIGYWSGGRQKALFLQHEGYCGSLGALLMQGSGETPSGSPRGPAPS